jgi:predicted AAA+ superfamily ATPase
MIPRRITNEINKRLADQKAIIILGPRQVGKTTVVRNIFPVESDTVQYWNGDESDIRYLLEQPTSTALKALIGNKKILIIDEAQRVENIGLCMKLIVDNITQTKLIATGSSSFDLANKINEPLTGRKWEFRLLPFSFQELSAHFGQLEEHRLLHHRLIYGGYPEVINNPGDEEAILKHLVDSYMFKDILTWERIKKSDRMERLVQALAFQIGHEVSYSELGKMVALDNETVEKYIQLLEKAFILFRIPSFSRNLRNELKKSRKIYFYDNGLRNEVIKQFNPLELRNDVGALWENYLVSERQKLLENNQIGANCYFWRTHAQQEIDYIEERGGKLFAYEFKWKKDSRQKPPRAFKEAYPDSNYKIITPDNYAEFVNGIAD